MANPFTVGFDGVDNRPTFLSALTRGTDEGKVVKVSANKTVALCSAENRFIGVVETIAPGTKDAVVAVGGFKTVAYSGTAPSAGYVELVANGSGGVKTPTTAGTGIYYWIVDVDTTNTKLTLLLG
jgi:hypothetical protein